MKFFVSSEAGTTSLLATALARGYDDPRQPQFRKAFCKRVERQSSQVVLSPEAGPSVVLLEYDCMDLLMVWSDWIIIVENKVADKSVDETQLPRYYHYVRKQLGKKKGEFLGTKDQKTYEFSLDRDALRKKAQICVVLLTPADNPGRLQLALDAVELHEKRNDQAIRLSWPCILADLKASFTNPTANDRFGCVIYDGVERTYKVIAEHASKWELDVKRNRTKKFLEEVWTQVATLLKPTVQDKRLLKLGISQSEKCDSFESHFGNNGCLLKLELVASQTDLCDRGKANLKGCLRFTMPPKVIKRRGKDFNAIAWVEKLCVEAGSLKVIAEKCCVNYPIELAERAHDADAIARLFCKFWIAFKPFMLAPSPGK
jgi:hypothetical protein